MALTETAEGFFLKAGYCRNLLDEAPVSIAATKQVQSLCPASASLLRLPLPIALMEDP